VCKGRKENWIKILFSKVKQFRMSTSPNEVSVGQVVDLGYCRGARAEKAAMIQSKFKPKPATKNR